MAAITIGGKTVHTSGNMPQKGEMAPDFALTNTDLKTVTLDELKGKKLVLNVFPSIDTTVCAASVRMFSKEVVALPNTLVVNISRDLPFAYKRFCAMEGIENAIGLADFKDKSFGKQYGLEMIDGPFAGLLSRAVLVLNEKGEVIYTEQVPEIADEPDYEAALAAVKS
jgi:thiol peroxidase